LFQLIRAHITRAEDKAFVKPKEVVIFNIVLVLLGSLLVGERSKRCLESFDATGLHHVLRTENFNTGGSTSHVYVMEVFVYFHDFSIQCLFLINLSKKVSNTRLVEVKVFRVEVVRGIGIQAFEYMWDTRDVRCFQR